MTLHGDARRLLAGWRGPDARQEQLRQEYVAHLDAHADGLRRTCLPDHVTASAVVLSPDGEQVLLTLHAKAGAWFQLGGHAEAGDATLAGAALREALEESGLDVRFLAVAAPDRAHAVSAESVDVRWFPVAELPSDEPSLRELVDLGRDRLRVRVGKP